jgi:hypothetical protein
MAPPVFPSLCHPVHASFFASCTLFPAFHRKRIVAETEFADPSCRNPINGNLQPRLMADAQEKQAANAQRLISH